MPLTPDDETKLLPIALLMLTKLDEGIDFAADDPGPPDEDSVEFRQAAAERLGQMQESVARSSEWLSVSDCVALFVDEMHARGLSDPSETRPEQLVHDFKSLDPEQGRAFWARLMARARALLTERKGS